LGLDDCDDEDISADISAGVACGILVEAMLDRDEDDSSEVLEEVILATFEADSSNGFAAGVLKEDILAREALTENGSDILSDDFLSDAVLLNDNLPDANLKVDAGGKGCPIGVFATKDDLKRGITEFMHTKFESYEKVSSNVYRQKDLKREN
jgi:hypothetical protein